MSIVNKVQRYFNHPNRDQEILHRLLVSFTERFPLALRGVVHFSSGSPSVDKRDLKGIRNLEVFRHATTNKFTFAGQPEDVLANFALIYVDENQGALSTAMFAQTNKTVQGGYIAIFSEETRLPQLVVKVLGFPRYAMTDFLTGRTLYVWQKGVHEFERTEQFHVLGEGSG